MTPREFLELIVRPNVNEFHDHYSDLRYAHNAVASVDAVAAHLYNWAKTNNPGAVGSSKTDSAYRSALAERNPNFGLLRDIAKAQKHVHLTVGKPKITRADQIIARGIRYGEGGYGEGRYGGPEQVVVEIGPGNFCYLESVIDQALTFIESEVAMLGA